MSHANMLTLITGTTDGVQWGEELAEAILLATDASEGLRSWGDLSAHLHDWWYATLDQCPVLYWPAQGPPEVTYASS